MTAITFNPLAATRELEAAGVERKQAEAIAEEMRRAADAAANADRSELATKADHAELENRLRADLAELKTRLLQTDPASKADLKALLSELRWMLGFLAALILAMAIKLFGIV